MLKLVLLGALFALSAAAPQFSLYPGYHPYSIYNFSPFPYMRSPLDTPYPFTQPHYPTPYTFNYPYQPSFFPTYPQLFPQEQTADQPAAVPVRSSAPHKEVAEAPMATPQAAPARPEVPDKGELSIESAKLYLTPEQQVLFEAAVAAMNPLEYAAKLDYLANPTPKDAAVEKPNKKPAKEGIEIPVVTSKGTPIRPQIPSAHSGELTIENAKLYLTPEQQVLFEAAVASMNPLEYAAQLDSLRNP